MVLNTDLERPSSILMSISSCVTPVQWPHDFIVHHAQVYAISRSQASIRHSTPVPWTIHLVRRAALLIPTALSTLHRTPGLCSAKEAPRGPRTPGSRCNQHKPLSIAAIDKSRSGRGRRSYGVKSCARECATAAELANANPIK